MDGEEGGLLVVGHGHGVGGGHQGDAVALGGKELRGAVVAQGQGQIELVQPGVSQDSLGYLADALLFLEQQQRFLLYIGEIQQRKRVIRVRNGQPV